MSFQTVMTCIHTRTQYVHGSAFLVLQEGMLKDLQKSVEEEELVWKSKLAASEDQVRAVSSAEYLNPKWS